MFFPFRNAQPRCSNGGGTPNRWVRSRIAANYRLIGNLSHGPISSMLCLCGRGTMCRSISKKESDDRAVRVGSIPQGGWVKIRVLYFGLLGVPHLKSASFASLTFQLFKTQTVSNSPSLAYPSA